MIIKTPLELKEMQYLHAYTVHAYNFFRHFIFLHVHVEL